MAEPFSPARELSRKEIHQLQTFWGYPFYPGESGFMSTLIVFVN